MRPSTDIILTLPCPLCPSPGRMLTATWEPAEGMWPDLLMLVKVEGCEHAEWYHNEVDPSGPRYQAIFKFYNALHHEIEMYMLDSAMSRVEREEC